ncbi:DUF3422 family protein [Janthinobacterium sp. PC23-8]|uniref:DUF3422 family protein n=1 Tax=Janthinobacterium sp. PC23-8 TaxID=2012679 RepID=UPI000B976EB1|nr:DUF3422 domain-containing protein [Janthinobacterium sp. PC23-8]OYO29835.1 hypothetical protein CD932_00770 [Janthinobacterium sp. PC23-8]
MHLINSSLNHALRVPLAAEIHSRPFLQLDAPELITHLAVYSNDAHDTGRSNMQAQHATLAALCTHFGVTGPSGEAKYFYYDFGRFRLKWECHTEFATFTFAEHPDAPVPLEQAFERMPLEQLPQQWLAGLKGKLMVAAHVVLERAVEPADTYMQGLSRVFEGNTLVGSEVLQGGELWTDFTIQSDGFSRFIIRDAGMRSQQSGRLVQRVLEIETYRMFALLGLPYAMQAAPSLSAIENELATLAAAMVETDNARGDDGASEQALLDRITRLAARIEKLSLDNSYRFSASKAYMGLVRARIEELREVRIEGIPTVEEFMDRRLTPAMNTCAAMASRQEAMAQRIANTNDLLRTRVGIVQELQNRQILQSMNARAAQQLQLQQAVEGLSVAAISYYVIGLFSYTGKAAKVMGLPVNPEILVGALVPFVAAGVWLGLRRMHHKLHVD